MKKKIISLLLAIIITLTIVPAMPTTQVKADTIGIGSNYRSSAPTYNLGDIIYAQFPYNLDYDYNSRGNSYYKFTLSKKVMLMLYAKTFGPDDKLYIEIFDCNGKIIDAYYTEDETDLGYQEVDSTIVLPAGTYYINITSLTMGWKDVYGAVAFDVLEEENNKIKMASYKNNCRSQAVPCSIGNYLMGSVTYDHDEDYYKFTVNDTRLVYFYGTWSSGDIDVRLCNASGSSLGYYTANGNEIGFSKVLTKGTYYLEVSRMDDCRYLLGVYSWKTATPSISGLSTKKKTITVSYKSSQKNCGYIVQISRNKNFKGSTTKYTKSNKYKFTRLKSKKRYYVRVRAYDSIYGNTMYGGWSKTKSIKCK